MSNLTRPTVDVLLNTLSKDDFGVYFDGSAKHLVLKKLGFDFVGANSTAVVKRYKAGQKMVRTLVPNWKWNGEATQVFQIEVTRQPLYDSTPENQHPISHSYQFIMSGFTTDTMGTLNAADKNAIFDGLIAAITADTQLNENAVLTGACVVATKTAAVDTLGSEVVGAIVLTAKNNGDIFTVRTYEEQFTQSVNPTTPQIKDKMPTVDIQRIFSIKEENVGQAITLPIADVAYACITITTRTQFVGLDLLGGVGQVVEQKVNLYMPVSILDDHIAKFPTDGTDAQNAIGMAGTGADKDIVEALAEVCTGSF